MEDNDLHAAAIAHTAVRSAHDVWVRVRSTDTVARAFRRCALRWVARELSRLGYGEAAHVLELSVGGLRHGDALPTSAPALDAGGDSDIMLHLSADPAARAARRLAARRWVAGKLITLGYPVEARVALGVGGDGSPLSSGEFNAI